MKRKSSAWISLILALGLRAPIARAAAAPAEVRAQLSSEPASFDPALADDDLSVKILANVLEGLVGYDGAGQRGFRLAEGVSISKDGRRYTFTLRKDLRWSDGPAITADDFVRGLTRTLDPRTGAKLANMLFPIRGAKAFFSGQGPLSGVGVRAERGKLVIELEKPAFYFLDVLTLPQAAPVRADILKANDGRWPAIAPSTGAYRVVSHLADRETRLEPNPNWWSAGRPRLPVVFKVVNDESTSVALFESGQLDLVSKIPATEIPRFKALGAVREFPQVSTYFLSFNARKAPFNDRDFRRAVAGSIDREGIVAAIGTGSPLAKGWIPPGLEGNVPYENPAAGFADSVARVRERLRKEPVAVAAAFNTSGQNSLIMEKIQSDLRKTLGLAIQLTNLDWKTYVGTIRADTPQLYRFGRGAPFMDPIWHLASFVGDDPNNPTGWKNAEYDRLVAEIAAMPAGKGRRAKIARAERILVDEEAIVVPVFYLLQTHLVAPRLQGYRVNPVNSVLFSEISLKAE